MRTVVSIVATTALLLTGCGQDEPSSDPTTTPTSGSTTTPDPPPATPDEPTSTDSSGSAGSAEPPCSEISDAQLTRWAGTSQTVVGPVDLAGRQECSTVVDSDDGLGLTWSFGDADGPLEQAVEAENFDGSLERVDLDLSGGQPAALLTGEVVGAPYAEVVVVIGDQLLLVEARETPIGEKPITVDTLADIATQVADAYSAG